MKESVAPLFISAPRTTATHFHTRILGVKACESATIITFLYKKGFVGNTSYIYEKEIIYTT